MRQTHHNARSLGAKGDNVLCSAGFGRAPTLDISWRASLLQPSSNSVTAALHSCRAGTLMLSTRMLPW